jgi:hypothetical protein
MQNITFIQNPWENKLLELVSNVEDELFISCPFIKEDIIKNILAHLKEKKLKILLKTNIFDISKNFCDLECLYLLNSHNTEVRTIKNLHAKLFIFDNEKAIVTSSNLTKAGLNFNVEFGFLVEDKDLISRKLLPIINSYWNSAKKVNKNEIENIKFDLNKFDNVKTSFNQKIKSSKNKHNSIFVSPKGRDISIDSQELVNKKKFEMIANRLMINEIEVNEIYALIKKYFKGRSAFNVLRNAFKYSFNSDNPLYTAGIYFKNASKIDKRMNIMLYKSNVNTFKNMIMSKGNTNIEIKTLEDYYLVENEYYNSFNVDPPTLMQVFDAILNDKKCIDQMVNDIKFFFRIRDIFPFFDMDRINKLKSAVLIRLNEKLDYSNDVLTIRIQNNDEEKIRKSKYEINIIEEKINILKAN